MTLINIFAFLASILCLYVLLVYLKRPKFTWRNSNICWMCLRCKQQVTRSSDAKQCNCTQSPSPWVLMRNYRPRTQQEVEEMVGEWHTLPQGMTMHIELPAFLGWLDCEYALWVESNELPDPDAPFNDPLYRDAVQVARALYKAPNLRESVINKLADSEDHAKTLHQLARRTYATSVADLYDNHERDS